MPKITKIKGYAKWTILYISGIALYAFISPRTCNTIINSNEFTVLKGYGSRTDGGAQNGKTDRFADAVDVKPDDDDDARASADEPNQYMPTLKKMAKRLKEQDRPMIYVASNDAFIPIANSWLCNTMFMDVHDQLLIIATDDKTRDYFHKRWPNITAISQPGDDLHGDQEFGKVGYWRMNIKRMTWTLMLLELGVDVFMVEMDSVWLVNPVPEMKELSEGVDIVTLQPHNIKQFACAGFLYIRPTPRSIKMWKKLLDKMRTYESWMEGLEADDKTSFDNNKDSDQGYLTQLVIKEKYGGITHRAAPYENYPDGRWYKTGKPENPDVIQNNFIKGNKNKIKRAKKFGHWFLDGATENCKVSRVKSVTFGL